MIYGREDEVEGQVGFSRAAESVTGASGSKAKGVKDLAHCLISWLNPRDQESVREFGLVSRSGTE
jgi:hypothetical protein